MVIRLFDAIAGLSARLAAGLVVSTGCEPPPLDPSTGLRTGSGQGSGQADLRASSSTHPPFKNVTISSNGFFVITGTRAPSAG